MLDSRELFGRRVEERGVDGPLEARFLMNGMLRSWDAILYVVI